MAGVLFPFGVRLTTWAFVIGFMAVAAWRTDRKPLLGLLAWLAGFETAYQVAAFLLTPPAHVTVIGSISLSLVVGMPTIAVAMTLLGARPNLRLLAAALAVFAVWIATGFHVNTGMVVTHPLGEALNDASKTLWALAYLVPLLRPQTRPAYTSAQAL